MGAMVIPFVAHAAGSATFSLSASDTSLEAGDRFTVVVSIAPNGEELDTVRAFLSFPADTFKAEDVELGSLFERQSPGNSINNTLGTISYGGFSLDGIVKTSGTFVTVTFTALAEGEAEIKVLDTSRLISNGIEKAKGEGASVTVTVGSEVLRVEGSESPIVTSTTHSDESKWYQGNKATLNWTKIEGVTRWLTAFDNDPESDPTEVITNASTTTYIDEDLEDGIWYFHIKGKLADGTFTQTAHFRVRSDSTAPNPVYPTTPRLRYTIGDDALLEFGTTDDMSGIDHYELSVNKNPYERVTSPQVLKAIGEGDYFIEIKAVDRAGNERFGKTGIRGYPAETELTQEDKAARETEQQRIKEFETAAELAASPSPKTSDNTLLITSVLAVLAGIAIIGAISLRRRKH